MQSKHQRYYLIVNNCGKFDGKIDWSMKTPLHIGTAELLVPGYGLLSKIILFDENIEKLKALR